MDKGKVRTRDQSVAFWHAGFEQIERGSFQFVFIPADSPDLSVSGDLSRTRTGSDPAEICEDRKV